MKHLIYSEAAKWIAGNDGIAQRQFTYAALQGIVLKAKPGCNYLTVVVNKNTNGRVDWFKQAGVFAPLIRPGKFKLPLAMLTQDAIDNLIYDVKIIMGNEPVDVNYNNNVSFVMAEHLAKLVVFCQSGPLRSEYVSKLKTLAKRPHLQMWWQVREHTQSYKTIERFDIVENAHMVTIQNIINNDYLAKGFMPVSDDMNGLLNIPVLKKMTNGDFLAIGGIKKAQARIKLADELNGATIQNIWTFVATGVGSNVIMDHVVGGGYCSNGLIEKYGASRFTNRFLAKGVLTPVTLGTENSVRRELQVIANDEEFIVIGKNAFKGEEQGLIEAGVDLKRFEYLTLSEDIDYDGSNTLTGYWVKMPVTITNLVVAYGISVVEHYKLNPRELILLSDEEEIKEFAEFFMNRYDSEEENSDVICQIKEEDKQEEQSSVYVYCMEKIAKTNGTFHVMKFISKGLELGIFEKSDTRASVKTSYVLNVLSTHGSVIANKFVNSVKRQQKPNELNQYLTGDLLTHKIEESTFRDIAGLVFPKALMDITKMSANMISVDDIVKIESYVDMIDFYLNGSLDSEWDGLKGLKPKTVTIHGHMFYIPSGKVLAKFIHNARDRMYKETGDIMLTGPAYLVTELLRQIALSEFGFTEEEARIEWFKYNSKLQAMLYGEYGDNFKVEGFANKMVVPHWDPNATTIACSDKRYAKWHGKTVVAAKLPVLFANAIHGIGYQHLDNYMGEVRSEEFMRALDSCVFVPQDILLMHQNDADGDMFCVFFLEDHGLPRLVTKDQLPVYMHDWVDNYVEGEMDLDIKPKTAKVYSQPEYQAAAIESVVAKRAIGISTNFLNTLGIVGAEYDLEGFKELRDVHAMLVQEIVRGVKHESASELLEFLSGMTFKHLCGINMKKIDDKWVDVTEWHQEDFVNHLGDMLSRYGYNGFDKDKTLKLIQEIRATMSPALFDSYYPKLNKLDKVVSVDPVYSYLQMHIRTLNGLPNKMFGTASYVAFNQYGDSWEREFFTGNSQSKTAKNYLLFAEPGKVSANSGRTGGLIELIYRLMKA